MRKLNSKILFCIIFVSCIVVSAIVTTIYITNKTSLEKTQMEQVILTRSNKVENIITKLLYKTQVLSALVIQSDGKIENFEQVAATIIDDVSIRNLIVAPGGKVTNVYPLAGNEGVLGLDYFSDKEGNAEARNARDTGKLVLGGPFELMQGGQALVGRLPVYIRNEFWGIVSVTLNYPDALAGAELDELKTQGFAFEIWRISPDTNKRQVISHSSYDYSQNSNYVEKPLNILNAEWFFRLSPIRTWYQFPETWIFIVCGILISCLIASLFVHNRTLRTMKSDLEYLSHSDPLTGILNRRGIFEHLYSILKSPTATFVLCYIDLDNFKEINDLYGHNVGDIVLCRFVEIVESHVDKDNIFGRMGGDEFVLIFKDDFASIEQFWKTIERDCTACVTTGNVENLSIGFSVGFARYPSEAKTLDELICIADHKMYKDKQTIYKNNQIG